ncbi:Hint domain-containing protein [uncultured Shimia sp.]|uniref:Hint domain-containing protein n=1 Tax=uncultured Shimia sp. TaxID=573152 RepID=UPI00262D413B|nr:Hint domain-containing protein [uncultured Shimia sp.]
MADPYISEVKYLGGPSLDFIEIVVDEGTDVSDILVTVYNPGGSVRTVNTLETYATTVNGFDVYIINNVDSSTFSGLNKSGAVSLSENGTVYQFISFDDGAPVTANGGAADGETSTQIGQAGAGESLEGTPGGGYTTQTDPNEGDIPCFLAGTRIATPKGEVAVEDLQRGDLVLDAFGNLVAVRQVLSRRVAGHQARKDLKLRPICIKAGALGEGMPERDLFVSRQHRIMVSSPIASRMLDSAQVLVAAHQFVGAPGVDFVGPAEQFVYHHLLLERHAVVLAEGAPCESFLVASQSMISITQESREKVIADFPMAKCPTYAAPSALPIPHRKKQARLIARHIKNAKAFLSEDSVAAPSNTFGRAG